jgi:lactam utilization protein B
VAEARGVPLLREILAGRVYADEARLVPLGRRGAAIEDPADAVRRIEDWRKTGYLALADGRRWLVEAETIGVSADLLQGLEIARAVRGALALK